MAYLFIFYDFDPLPNDQIALEPYCSASATERSHGCASFLAAGSIADLEDAL